MYIFSSRSLIRQLEFSQSWVLEWQRALMEQPAVWMQVLQVESKLVELLARESWMELPAPH